MAFVLPRLILVVGLVLAVILAAFAVLSLEDKARSWGVPRPGPWMRGFVLGIVIVVLALWALGTGDIPWWILASWVLAMGILAWRVPGSRRWVAAILLGQVFLVLTWSLENPWVRALVIGVAIVALVRADQKFR